MLERKSRRSSNKVVLLENENPARRRRRLFQYSSCLPESENPAGPATAVSVLKLYYRRGKIQLAAGDGRSSTMLYYQRTKIQPAAGDGRSSTMLYYQRTKIQPAAGDGRSSTEVVLPEDEKLAGRRRRPFQYQRFTTRAKIQPAAAVPVLKSRE